jgi:hypothetical protein
VHRLAREWPRPRGRRGQALVLLACLIPLVLLPVAAYAVEATYAASRAALLEWACVRAAEDAAQSLDANALRASSVLQVDPATARLRAQAELSGMDPRAVLDRFSASGDLVQLSAHETVPVTLAIWVPGRVVRVGASASARLTPGYASPSSRRPLPISSFWVASSLRPSSPSSSRQRPGWRNG